jgi:hypothetical protein
MYNITVNQSSHLMDIGYIPTFILIFFFVVNPLASNKSIEIDNIVI